MSNPSWSNRLAFILTASSFAVGLGNIWRFPYMVGSGGGGAFLLIYILLAAGIGFPILLSEFSLGRMSKSSPLTGFSKISGNKRHNAIGWISVVATTLMLGFYVMIMAWIGIYFYGCLTGHILTISDDFNGHFNQVSGSFSQVFLISLAILFLSIVILMQGLKKGIEALAKIFMPILFALIIILGIWSSSQPGAWEGIAWYLTPDLSKIDMEVILGALSQVFFSVGIGMTTVFVFGSYSGKNQNIILDSSVVIFVDTLVAFLAGFVIFPVLFSYGISPDSGPSLLFITMTNLIAEMPFGLVFGSLFFFLLMVAGLTSVVTVIEGISQSLKDRFSLSQSKALWICLAAVTFLLIPNILSHTDSIFSDLNGKSFFGWTDLLSNSILLPIAGLCIVLFASYIVGFDKFSLETNIGSTKTKVRSSWRLIWQVLIPICIIIILIYGLWQNA